MNDRFNLDTEMNERFGDDITIDGYANVSYHFLLHYPRFTYHLPFQYFFSKLTFYIAKYYECVSSNRLFYVPSDMQLVLIVFHKVENPNNSAILDKSLCKFCMMSELMAKK